MKSPPPPVIINRPYGLCKYEPAREYLSIIDKQLRSIINVHAGTFSVHTSVYDQLAAMARSAYLQGVLDAMDHYKEVKGGNNQQ